MLYYDIQIVEGNTILPIPCQRQSKHTGRRQHKDAAAEEHSWWLRCCTQCCRQRSPARASRQKVVTSSATFSFAKSYISVSTQSAAIFHTRYNPCSPNTFWRRPFWRQIFRHMLSLALSPWFLMDSCWPNTRPVKHFLRYKVLVGVHEAAWLQLWMQIMYMNPASVSRQFGNIELGFCPAACWLRFQTFFCLVLTWDDALIFFAITLLTLLKLKLPRAVWMERMVRFSDPSPVFLSAYCGRSRPGSNAKSTAKSQ